MAWIVRLVSLGPATRAPRPPPRSAVVVASGPGAALAEGAAAPGGATVQSVEPRAGAQTSRVVAKLVDASWPRTPAPLEQPGARWRRAGEDDAGGAMAADHGLAVANHFSRASTRPTPPRAR